MRKHRHYEEINKEFKELIETLADLEHKRWAKWQKYLHSKCTRNYGTLVIPSKYVEHLEKMINTPYSELSEAKKEMDRKEVRKYLKIISNWEESF